MNTQINEIHLAKASRKNAKPRENSSAGVADALDTFLLSPSYNTKQIALESFWRHLTIGNANISSQES